MLKPLELVDCPVTVHPNGNALSKKKGGKRDRTVYPIDSDPFTPILLPFISPFFSLLKEKRKKMG